MINKYESKVKGIEAVSMSEIEKEINGFLSYLILEKLDLGIITYGEAIEILELNYGKIRRFG